MEFQERIIYNSRELIQLIEGKLDKLSAFRFDSCYRELLGDKFIQKLTEWDKNIRSRKEDPFTIVVCGEFKRGKSSLINALLGEEVVTTNVTTETVTLNKISYGPHSNEAVLSGGRRLRLSDEELSRSRLEEIFSKAGEPIRQLELKRPIDMLKQVTIIDTPGLGDSLKDFSGLVEEALQQADAVIYVFSVSYPISQTEQLFMKTEILPQRYTDIFLVGNYADILKNEEDYERMSAMLVQKIRGLLPGIKPWLLSALDERCIQCGEKRPNEAMANMLSESFSDFREALDGQIEEKREVVLPDRMQRMLRGMKEELSQTLSAMEKGLAMESSAVQEALENADKQCGQQGQEETLKRLHDKTEEMKAQTYEKISRLLNLMQQEADTLGDMKAEEITKYYSFYCIDTLQEAMNSCAEQHTMELYDMLEEISGELAKGLTNIENKSYSFRFALDNRTWTRGDNVSYVLSKVNIGALSLIADGITGAMRNKEIEKKTTDILQSIKAQYGSLRSSCLNAVEDLYNRLEENVKKQLDEYYGEKVRAAKEQAEQLAMVARQDEEKKAKIKEAIEKLRAVLGEMEL